MRIIGYARTQMTREEFVKGIREALETKISGGAKDALNAFLQTIDYLSGPYDDSGQESWAKLSSAVGPALGPHPIRLFYLALPPNLFGTVAENIRLRIFPTNQIPPDCIRVVIEKPFGHDAASSMALSQTLGRLFAEDQLYRIDHYLGKEMVKNVLTLRHFNLFFSALWNRQHISSVQIVFKETIGVEGRGGYFDQYGIIRDVMQNHLLQILAIVAMERPVSLAAEAVRNEKVKVLSCIPPLALEDLVIGQYVRGTSDIGYLDEPSVLNKDSRAATFAMATLRVCNERWDGVPFILRCGKALNEPKAEIRIQFRDVPGMDYFCLKDPSHHQQPPISRNELVIRVQPKEAVYLKMLVKRPGLSDDIIVSDLDLSYAQRYSDVRIPEAYEALLLDVLRGDHSNFVRDDELDAAWRIFTPVLHQLERDQVQPLPYTRGSRGPAEADARLAQFYKRHVNEYIWTVSNIRRFSINGLGLHKLMYFKVALKI